MEFELVMEFELENHQPLVMEVELENHQSIPRARQHWPG